MNNKIYIKDFYHRIIGTIEEDREGNKVAKDFYQRIVGKYKKKQNLTYDFYNRIVGRGDVLSSLIPPIDQQIGKQK